jgi:hypothetical protein
MAHERGTADHPSLSFLKMAYSSVRIETEAFRAPNNRHPDCQPCTDRTRMPSASSPREFHAESSGTIAAPEGVDLIGWKESDNEDREQARAFVKRATPTQDEQEKREQPEHDRLWGSIPVPGQT